MNSLDSRLLPISWPAPLREATEAARGVRDNVLLKTLIEGILIERSTGSTVGFTEHVAIDYLRQRLGDEGVRRYREGGFADAAAELEGLAAGAGWKTSPLTVGLTLTHDLNQLYAPAPHLRVISDAILDAVNGRGPKNVLISLPSRYGKSETAGRRTLEWFFANYPGLPAIYVSATDDLGSTMGRLVRNDLDLHKERFGFELAEDSSAAGRFNTSIEGGQLISTGIFGQVVGKGAALMIVDDLFKNSEQANSAVYRDQVWDLWLTSLQSRLQSGAVLVAIGTRWHTADYLGRLLTGWGDVGPLDCRYIRFPALGEEEVDHLGRRNGEPLPLGPVQVSGFGYTREELEERKRSTGAETWATCYQQTPIDETKIGRAYAAFDEKTHVYEIDRDDRLAVRLSLDFNVNPLAAVFGQVRDVSDRMRTILTGEHFYSLEILDELILPDTNTHDAAEAIIEKLRRWVPPGRRLKLRISGDASGNARRSSAALEAQTDWAVVRSVFGRYTHLFEIAYDIKAKNPGVYERVSRVNSFLRSADGSTRFGVDPRCRGLIRDLQKVRWARDSFGNSLPVLDKKDSQLTHPSDALGYLVMSIGVANFVGEVAALVF